MTTLKTKLPFFLFATILFVACTTVPIEQVWDPRIGNYSYEQAVSTYDKPTEEETLDSGQKVATWTRMYGSVSSPYTDYHLSGEDIDYTYRHDRSYTETSYTEKLILTFDAHGVLEKWVLER